MSEPTSRLPARPSLEHLRKQAKNLLRDFRNGAPDAVERVRRADARLAAATRDDVTLADTQMAIARHYGFSSWPQLVDHVVTNHPAGMKEYEKIATEVAEAYMRGDAMAIREINWSHGTSFVWDGEPERMQQRLRSWFASASRSADLATADARQLVARQFGSESWSGLVGGLSRRSRAGTPNVDSAALPYRIDVDRHSLELHRPLSRTEWDTIVATMQSARITRLEARGHMSDEGLERVARIEHLTQLDLGGSQRITDAGLHHLASLGGLEEFGVGGWKSQITDRGLEVLRHLHRLERLDVAWVQGITNAGLANVSACEHLERVNLLGTRTGDGAIMALTGKPRLSHVASGANCTDTAVSLLHDIPVFATWHGGQTNYGLMSYDAEPNRLTLSGSFSNRGLAGLADLEGLFGLELGHNRNSAFTSDAFAPLATLPHLGFLACDGERCDDVAMRHIAAMPKLRMLLAQGMIAGDEGFEALSRSTTLEYIWGRECPNLTGRGFVALASLSSLRGMAMSLKGVDDGSLASLRAFPSLRELMPMDVSDNGFRHIGGCVDLEKLWCMYCRDTGDEATRHIAGLNLDTYYAGSTHITDASLEILAQMQTLEDVSFWDCADLTDAGIASLATLPSLRRVSIEGSPNVTGACVAYFAPTVHVSYAG